MRKIGRISATMLLFLSAVLLTLLVSTVGSVQGASGRARLRLERHVVAGAGDIHGYEGLQLQYNGKTSDGQYQFRVNYDGSLGCVLLHDDWHNLYNGLDYIRHSRYSCGGDWTFSHALATPGIQWDISVHDDSAPGFRVWSGTVGIKTSP